MQINNFMPDFYDYGCAGFLFDHKLPGGAIIFQPADHFMQRGPVAWKKKIRHAN